MCVKNARYKGAKYQFPILHYQFPNKQTKTPQKNKRKLKVFHSIAFETEFQIAQFSLFFVTGLHHNFTF